MNNDQDGELFPEVNEAQLEVNKNRGWVDRFAAGVAWLSGVAIVGASSAYLAYHGVNDGDGGQTQNSIVEPVAQANDDPSITIPFPEDLGSFAVAVGVVYGVCKLIRK